LLLPELTRKYFNVLVGLIMLPKKDSETIKKIADRMTNANAILMARKRSLVGDHDDNRSSSLCTPNSPDEPSVSLVPLDGLPTRLRC